MLTVLHPSIVSDGVGHRQPAQQSNEVACMQTVLSARTDGLMLAKGLAFKTIANQSAQIAANDVCCRDMDRRLNRTHMAITYFRPKLCVCLKSLLLERSSPSTRMCSQEQDKALLPSPRRVKRSLERGASPLAAACNCEAMIVLRSL